VRDVADCANLARYFREVCILGTAADGRMAKRGSRYVGEHEIAHSRSSSSVLFTLHQVRGEFTPRVASTLLGQQLGERRESLNGGVSRRDRSPRLHWLNDLPKIAVAISALGRRWGR
jgi:hypothetical protein